MFEPIEWNPDPTPLTHYELERVRRRLMIVCALTGSLTGLMLVFGWGVSPRHAMANAGRWEATQAAYPLDPDTSAVQRLSWLAPAADGPIEHLMVPLTPARADLANIPQTAAESSERKREIPAGINGRASAEPTVHLDGDLPIGFLDADRAVLIQTLRSQHAALLAEAELLAALNARQAAQMHHQVLRTGRIADQVQQGLEDLSRKRKRSSPTNDDLAELLADRSRDNIRRLTVDLSEFEKAGRERVMELRRAAGDIAAQIRYLQSGPFPASVTVDEPDGPPYLR